MVFPSMKKGYIVLFSIFIDEKDGIDVKGDAWDNKNTIYDYQRSDSEESLWSNMTLWSLTKGLNFIGFFF